MTPVEFMSTFIQKLIDLGNDTNKFDKAISSLTTFTSASDVISAIHSDIASSASPEDFLLTCCGIDFTTSDIGSLLGSDVSGLEPLTADSVVDESGITLQRNIPYSFNIGGLAITLVPQTSSQGIFINQALYSWWYPLSFEAIKSGYGLEIDGSSLIGTMDTDLFQQGASGGAIALAYVSIIFDSSGKPIKMSCRINTHNDAYGTIDLNNSNGVSATLGSNYLDRTLLHELTHAMMTANIEGFASLVPMYFVEGSAELINGCEDTRGKMLKASIADVSILDDGFSSSPTSDLHWYTSGYIFLRYLIKKFTSVPTGNVDTNLPIIEVYEDSCSNGIKFKHGLARDIDFKPVFDEFTKFVTSSDDNVQSWGICDGSTSLDDIKGYTFRIPLKDSKVVEQKDIIDIRHFLCDEGAFVLSDIYCNCYAKDAILPVGLYLPNSYSTWFQNSMECKINLSFDYATETVSFSRSKEYAKIFGKSPCYMMIPDHHGVLDDKDALTNAFHVCNAVSMLTGNYSVAEDGYRFTSYRPNIGRIPDFISLIEDNNDLPATFPIIIEVGCTGSTGHLNYDYLYSEHNVVWSDTDKLSAWHKLLSLGREVYLGLVPLDSSFALSDFDKSVLALSSTYSNLHIIDYDINKLSYQRISSNQELFDRCCAIYSIEDYSDIADYVEDICKEKSHLYEDITRRYAEIFFPYKLHNQHAITYPLFKDLFLANRPVSPQYDYLLTGFAYTGAKSGEAAYSMQDYFQVQYNRHVPPSVSGSSWLSYYAGIDLYSGILSNLSNLVSDGVKNIIICLSTKLNSSSVAALNNFDAVLKKAGIRLIVLFAFQGGRSILSDKELHDSYNKFWVKLSCSDRLVNIPEKIEAVILNRFYGIVPDMSDFYASLPTYIVKNYFQTNLNNKGINRYGYSASGAINALLYHLYPQEDTIAVRRDVVNLTSPCYYLTLNRINSSNLFDFPTFSEPRPPQVIRNTGEALTFNVHTLYDKNLPSYEQGGGLCKDLFDFDTEGEGKTANLLNWVKSITVPGNPSWIMKMHEGCYTYPARNTGCSWFTYSEQDKDVYDSIEFFFVKENYGGSIILLFYNSIDSTVVPVWQTLSFGVLDVYDDTHKFPLFIAGGTTGLSPDSYTYSYTIPGNPPTTVTKTVTGNSYNFRVRQLSGHSSNLLYPTLLSGCDISNFAVLSEDGVWKYLGNCVQSPMSNRAGALSDIVDESNFFIMPTASDTFNYEGALGLGDYYISKLMSPVYVFHGSIPNMEERGIVGTIKNHYAVRNDSHVGILVINNKRYLITPNGWLDRMPYVVSGSDDDSYFRDLDNANRYLFKYNLAIYIGDVAQ